MACVPADNVESESAADPLLMVAVPSVVAPSMNWTVPVAVLGVTAAVRAMLCPLVEGFAEEATVTLVAT